MVLPAEFPLRLPALMLAGARIDVAQVPFLGWLIPVVLGARLVAKTLVAGCGALLSPPLRRTGPALIPGLMACGPTSMCIGLAFALRFPGRVGETVLVSAAAATVLGEVLSPLGLRLRAPSGRRGHRTDRPAAGGGGGGMSGTGEHRRAGNRGVELLLLLVLVGLMLLARNATPEGGGSDVLTALGFLLLAGTVVANVLEPLGIPHLTAYLITGMVAGPHAAHLVDHRTVDDLSPINALALSLISLAGGAELRVSMLISAARSLLWSTLIQNVVVLLLMAGTFFALRPFLPFADALPLTAVVGVSLLWGMMAITRSPSATLGVLSQTRAKGPLSTFTLAFVMTSDVVVVVLLAIVFTIARPLIEPGTALSLRSFRELGHEVLGSVALGSTLGLLLAAYLRFVGRQLVLVFVALGLVMTQVLDYLRFDWLLIFITAGFVVQNLSTPGRPVPRRHRAAGGDRLRHLLRHRRSAPGPAAAREALAAGPRPGGRPGRVHVGARAASPAAWPRIRPTLRRWGWSGLVSQAGLALGIAARIQGEFPSFGAAFAAMAVATVALNELVGPVLFKTALDRTGRVRRAGRARRRRSRRRPPREAPAIAG